MKNKPEAGPRKLRFCLNGEEITRTCNPSMRLIDLLRNDLGLTGTKESCREGTCGACVVLVDGKTVRSCLTPVSEVEGLPVTTIEGLGTLERPHPLQRAFVQAGAIQCGFCTPGAIMRAKALLDRNPDPTRDQVALALAGNLCRCTGYKRIIDAVMRAAEDLRNPSPTSGPLPVQPVSPSPPPVSTGGMGPVCLTFSAEDASKRAGIGSEVQLGAWEKALGRTRYAADYTPDNCLHACIVRSARSHALIEAIDPAAVLRLPGVVAVYTAADIQGTNRVGPIKRDQPVLADDRTRYEGEALAVVVAETRALAEEAAAKVLVRYRDLPPVFDPEEALKPESPQLHGDSNLLFAMQISKGSVQEGFARADVILESTYETPFNAHAYLEPDAGVAWRDEQDGLVLRLSTQNPFEKREQAAKALGIPLERIRVIQSATGGGFGGRMNAQLASILVLCASKLSRPVKLVMTAAENLIANDKRHPFKIRFKTGATKEGKLVALEAELIANTGAYASYGKAVLERAHIHATGPYEIPNVQVHGSSVYTNAPPAGAMRAFGVPQISFAVENQMDLLAEKLGMDPLEIRRRNLFHAGSVTCTGQVLDASVGAEKTLEAVEPYYREALAWAREGGTRRAGVKRGVGVACIFYGIGEAGFRNPATAKIGITPDGWIELKLGAADIGQGVFSTMALIAAETLGVPLEIMRVITPDTRISADMGPTEASRMTMFAGNALRTAAGTLRDVMGSLSPGGMDADQWKNGIARLYEMCRSEGVPTEYSATYTPPIQPVDKTGAGSPHLAYTFASHLAQVEVDTQRGSIRVVRLVAANDVGRAVNPLTLEGQIEGGMMMALGFALKEEYLPGVTRKWSQYEIPRTLDLPEMVSLVVEDPTPHGPFGAKGIGEPTMVGPASAMVSAVAGACGYRAHKLPIRLKKGPDTKGL